MSEKETKGAEYDFYGKLPLCKAIPLGLQHVLAMFVGNLTPLLIITGACGLTNTQEFANLQVDLLQNAMLVAGIVTLVQLYAIGPVGGKVPIIMGTSSGFIGVFNSVVGVMGGGILSYGAIMMASILGGIFEGILGFFLKPLRRFFPALVTGTVVLSIGLSLIAVGVNSFGGGDKAADFGSVENLLLGTLVLVVIVVLKHGTKGMTSSSSILIGIIVGYIAAAIMGLVLPTTGVTAEGVEYTKAWVLNWDKVAEASWFSMPKLMPVKPVFDWRAVIPVMIMFVVTAVETVGDISGVTEGGMGREATDTELSGGIICDGIGSSFAALFGVLPNTSFSQNVGLV
ncbi:MAG: uracil-xanthine permease family protein, partial [Clostridium sp.]